MKKGSKKKLDPVKADILEDSESGMDEGYEFNPEGRDPDE
jgi:hypothetical protein